MISLQVFPRIGAVRTRGPDGKVRTAGARVISQSDSRIYDSGPLRCLKKNNGGYLPNGEAAM